MARKTISFEDWGKNFGNQSEKKSSPPKKFSSAKNFTQTNFSGQNATAPYNFVSLPEKILPAPIADIKSYKAQIKTAELFSGEIAVKIETLTPLFIGGNGEQSFSPAGKFIIPGSSLRGMFKNIFKIVTCGAFRGGTNSQQKGEDFNDEHIYFRSLMKNNQVKWNDEYNWSKDLTKKYTKRMVGEKGKNARPGFLIQTFDNEYFIAPLKPNLVRKNDFIMIRDFQKKFRPVKDKDSCVYWDLQEKKAYILTGNQWEKKSWKLLTRREYEEFKKSLKGKTEKARQQIIRETNHGKQIIRFLSLDYIDWSKRIELPDEVLKSYEHDRNIGGLNLIEEEKNSPKNEGILHREQLEKLCENLPADVKTLIPCHFLYEKNQVTAFGHGQCFRIPYKNSIGDVVPKKLQDEKIIDFADAVFGRKENWASRVAFEDATPISEVKFLEKSSAHPLMQPNPTSFQLYLIQEDGKPLKCWEDDKSEIEIRGYKLYWHNDKCDWHATDAEKELDESKPEDKRATKKLTPLAPKNIFQSKIRFQNLSEIELGALMMIFDLKNVAYKIGMGKSFGFGSVKITPQLFIESDDAYTNIFDGDKFKNPYEKVDEKNFLDAFKNYVERQGMSATWQKIIDELQKILDWDNKPASNKIAQMKSTYDEKNKTLNVNEKFKLRLPLKNIFEVLR